MHLIDYVPDLMNPKHQLWIWIIIAVCMIPLIGLVVVCLIDEVKNRIRTIKEALFGERGNSKQDDGDGPRGSG